MNSLGRGGALLVAALAAAFLASGWRLLAGDPITDAAERRLLDLRFNLRGGWPVGDAVAILAVDEASADAFGTPSAMRGALAEAIERLSRSGARAVALDLLLVEETVSDPALAKALKEADAAFLAVSAMSEEWRRDPPPAIDAALDRSAIPIVAGPGHPPVPQRLLAPNETLAAAARLAHVNLIRSPDRVVRALPLALPAPGGRMLPALPLAAVAAADGGVLHLERGSAMRHERRRIAIDAASSIVIDHPGPRGAIPSHGLRDLLEGRTSRNAFAGRIVFVGATAESLGDVFATPYGPDLPGVEILAGASAGLREGRTIRRDATTGAATAGLALAFAALAFIAATRAGAGVSALASLAAWAAAAAALQAAFSAGGLWLDAVAVAAGLALGQSAGVAARQIRTRGTADAMTEERRNLARFVPRGFADGVAAGGPGFTRSVHDAAVLFVDMAGFTSRSETADPREMADLLGRLHARFEAAATRHGGVVTDFQGDGALMVFGLAAPARDDASRALACACELADGIGAPGDEAGRVRAAVHYGAVAPAVLGGREHSVISLAGDAVNLASRLQAFAKEQNDAVVATRETLDAAGETAARGFEFLRRTQVSGRRQEVEVWVRRRPGDDGAA